LAWDGGSSTKSVEFHNDHQKLVEPSDPHEGAFEEGACIFGYACLMENLKGTKRKSFYKKKAQTVTMLIAKIKESCGRKSDL
jgi:hypothetical protein